MNTYYCSRYDVQYDINTGKILESICSCDPYECQFTYNWIADGKPTIIPMEYRDHLIEAEIEAEMEKEQYDEIEWRLMGYAA